MLKGIKASKRQTWRIRFSYCAKGCQHHPLKLGAQLPLFWCRAREIPPVRIGINPAQGQVPAKSCKYWFIFTNMRISNPTTLRPTHFWHLQSPSIWTYKQHTKHLHPKPLVFHVVKHGISFQLHPVFFPHQVTSGCSCHSSSCWKTRSAVGRSPTSVEGPDPKGVPPMGNQSLSPKKVGIYVGYHHHPQQSLEKTS